MKSPKLTYFQSKELSDFISQNNRSSKELKRAQAIVLLDKNEKIENITAITKLQRARIFGLRQEYLSEGISAIEDQEKKKSKELLTKNQRTEISKILHSKKPSELDAYFSNYDYWTTGCLADWIKRKFDVVYKSKTSLYVIFKQSKFTFHKPGRVYQKRDEKEVAEWKIRTKPIIQKAFEEKNTVILAEDEMILSTQTTMQKIWLPQGDYPKIEFSNKRENKSIYGFLNIKTGKEHAFKTDWQNMFITTDVLKKVRVIYPRKKILLFWDGPGWHKGSEVLNFLQQDGDIDIVHFPKYSPEENPQEHVWKKGRAAVTHNFTINDIDKTADDFVNYLNTNTFSYSLLDIT
jgi:transposase